MKKLLYLFLLMILFTGCYGKPTRTTCVGKDEKYKVDFLFEIDGIRVYRFMDGGEYIYLSSRDSTFRRKQNGDTTTPYLQIHVEEE